MVKSMKRTSVLVVALMMLLSLSVAYATSDVVAIYKNGSSTELSMANEAVVSGSQSLEVNGDEATLTFEIKTFYKWFIPGNMKALSVDFNGDGNYTSASFSGNTVTIDFPASELKAGKNFYHATVKNDVAHIPMPTSEVEFCITK